MTGTFDDWAKSVKLEKKGEGFEKLVDLPQSEEKILYKVRNLSGPLVSSCTLVQWQSSRGPRQACCIWAVGDSSIHCDASTSGG